MEEYDRCFLSALILNIDKQQQIIIELLIEYLITWCVGVVRSSNFISGGVV